MGCDIHLFIEYATPMQNGSVYWRPFGGDLHIGRDYSLFARLAGARAGEDFTPQYPPRGMPNDPAHEAKGANELYIEDNPEPYDRDRYTSSASAASWVASGCSHYVGEDRGKVTDPDHHTHSWLTYHELWEVIGDAKVDMCAVLAAMRVFEDAGKATRIIFWFDN